MIKLTKYDYKENQSAESIIDLAKSQIDLGLGNPNTDALVQDKYTEKQRKIVEFCPQVEDPTKKYRTYQEGVREWRQINNSNLPRVVTVYLDNTVRTIRTTIEMTGFFSIFSSYTVYEASIPLIPKSIQELAKRVKNIDKSAEFYMVFEPKWQEIPTPVLQGDPILVAKVDDKFFMVGYWDGDLDLLKEI